MRVFEFGLKSLRLTFIPFPLLPWRFYSQNVSGSDAVFNPTTAGLIRADKEFEFLGPRTTLQGSAKKMADAPKLKLPEVMFCLTKVRSICLNQVKSILFKVTQNIE